MTLILILQATYYFLPAYIGNMFPVIFKKYNPLSSPVDGGKKWRGRPIFGAHKTWGGLLLGITGGLLTFTIQKYFINLPTIEIIDYNNTSVMLGVLLGSGAMLGDIVKSFFKRRTGKKAGEKFFPWDQIDQVVGGLLLSAIMFLPRTRIIITLFILTPILVIITNKISYLLRLKDVSW